MRLEQQVCSLELAKRLRELGVEQESLHYWRKFFDGWSVCGEPLPPPGIYSPEKVISAFTVAELGEMLPVVLDKNEKGLWLRMWKDASKHGAFGIEYVNDEVKHISGAYPRERADTEADARAKMLIYLAEKKLLKVAEKGE